MKAPGTLRLRIIGTTVLTAFWSGQDGAVRSIPIGIHGGMNQDSILGGGIFKDAPEASQVDFRYLQYDYPWYYQTESPGLRNRIEPYKISSGIKTLQIVNEGFLDVEFGSTGNTVLCTAGKTTLIAVGNTAEMGGQTLQRL